MTQVAACSDFQNGRCFRERCRYAHMMPDGAAVATTSTAQPCKDFANGKCTRGRGCRFSHDSVVHQVEGPPGANPAQIAYMTQFAQWQAQYGAQYQAAMIAAQHVAMTNPAAAQHHDTVAQQMQQLLANPYAGYNALSATLQSSTPTSAATYSAEVCRDFTQGFCHRGTNCRFTHVGQSTTHAPSRCGDYARGACVRGASCRYSHEDNVVADICRDFLSGRCERGADCRFVHGQSQEPCRDFQLGACLRANCKFQHSIQDSNANTGVGQQECRDFKMGLCSRAHCKFRHGDIVPVMQAKLAIAAASNIERKNMIEEMQQISSDTKPVTQSAGDEPATKLDEGSTDSEESKKRAREDESDLVQGDGKATKV